MKKYEEEKIVKVASISLRSSYLNSYIQIDILQQDKPIGLGYVNKSKLLLLLHVAFFSQVGINKSKQLLVCISTSMCVTNCFYLGF